MSAFSVARGLFLRRRLRRLNLRRTGHLNCSFCLSAPRPNLDVPGRCIKSVSGTISRKFRSGIRKLRNPRRHGGVPCPFLSLATRVVSSGLAITRQNRFPRTALVRDRSGAWPKRGANAAGRGGEQRGVAEAGRGPSGERPLRGGDATGRDLSGRLLLQRGGP